MRGLQIVTPAACVGLVLAFAAMSPVRAAAQSDSEMYQDRWARPHCTQPLWDQKKVDDQDMRWDIKVTEPEDVSDVSESERWHDRRFRSFATQPLWDEGRIESHFLMRHPDAEIKPVNLSGLPHSEHWNDRWSKPFYLQPAWDEQRWEEHCMGRDKTEDREMGYRHKDTADVDYRSE